MFTLDVAAGGPAEPAQLVSFQATGVRLVKFDTDSAHSGLAAEYVGLSEVLFRGPQALLSTSDTDVGIAQRPALLHATRNPGPSLSYRVLPGVSATGRLEVFDVLGRRVYEQDVPRTGPEGRLVNVAGVELVPGVYFARLRLETSTWTLRSVVTP